MSSKTSAKVTRIMIDANQTVVDGKPQFSTINPPNVGPTNEPQKNEEDHIPKKINLTFILRNYSFNWKEPWDRRIQILLSTMRDLRCQLHFILKLNVTKTRGNLHTLKSYVLFFFTWNKNVSVNVISKSEFDSRPVSPEKWGDHDEGRAEPDEAQDDLDQGCGRGQGKERRRTEKEEWKGEQQVSQDWYNGRKLKPIASLKNIMKQKLGSLGETVKDVFRLC